MTLKVYDVLGREVATLLNDYAQAGSYEITFNARNFASGLYFYRLTSSKFTAVKSMMLIK